VHAPNINAEAINTIAGARYIKAEAININVSLISILKEVLLLLLILVSFNDCKVGDKNHFNH